MTATRLSATVIVAEAERVLRGAAYERITRTPTVLRLSEPHLLVAEDAYGVVLLVVYNSWLELSERWSQAQEALVNAISSRMTKSDPKAWDGYLVLLCADEASPSDEELANRIRNDTAYVRKLVAGGDELWTLADVERVLVPLTPITLENAVSLDRDVLLERLPELLAERRLDPASVRQVIAAFRHGEPVMDALDRVLHQ
jgi:hypothetical protein